MFKKTDRKKKFIDNVKIVELVVNVNKNNIKVVNKNNDMNEKTDDEILIMIKKNEILNNDVNLKIQKRIVFEKRENWSMVLETDNKTHQQLLNQGIIYLRWQRCKIFDSIDVRRCFNCWGYGHTKKSM